MEIIRIVIEPFGLRIKAKKGQILSEVIKEAGIKFPSICDGLGRCGKCRILVTHGKAAIHKPTKAEQEHLSDRDLSIGFRLACQVKVKRSIGIKIPREGTATQVRLQTEGLKIKVSFSPRVRKFFVGLPKPTLQSLVPDLERLLGSLRKCNTHPSYISLRTLRNLPETLRSSDWKVTATVWNNKEILDVEGGDTCNTSYGLAIDVGTTKIALHLVDFSTEQTIAVSGIVNPQVSYGEDVLSRITYAMRGEKERKQLQKELVKGINHLIAECRSKHKFDPRHVYEAAVVGNTAMHHMLLGICPRQLALSPYVPAAKGPLNMKAKELGLDMNPDANVHFLPIIAGFVGSDCLAGILATGLFRKKDLCILLDIGTNTEVVVGNQDRILSCSCASGPAFEGGHIKQGIRASSGAIENVTIDQETMGVSFRTIDNVVPKGLCGSGIVDVIAEMLKVGIIDKMGLIEPEACSPRLRINKDGESEFVVVQGRDSSGDVVVTQKDIGAIQLAKAAVYTAISILMQEMKVEPQQINRVYIAGAFGTYVNPANARTIGMIPAFPLNIVTSVGNTATAGARMALVSSKHRMMCEKISKRVEYIELATHPSFHPVFMESLCFPPTAN